MLSKIENIAPNDIAVVGLPFDDFSSFLKGPAKAPDEITRLLHCGAMNLCSESGIDFGETGGLKEVGNITPISHPDDIINPIEGLIERGARIIALGGDHSLSYGTIKAHAKAYPKLTVLHFDAHPDLHDEYNGNKYSHACPFARVMEQNLAVRLIQVGIRTLTPHQHEQAKKFGVEIIQMSEWSPSLKLKMEGPVFISFDIDVLDPAFAPGISHHEPGGMTTRDAIDFINNQEMDLVGADIMEYNPDRDINDVTGMVCAKLLKELAAKMLP